MSLKFFDQSPEKGEDAIELAKSVGLDKIDYEKIYKLTKLGAKVSSKRGYPDKMVALHRGKFAVVSIKSQGKLYAWIVGTWINGDWFRTSPIVSVKKIKAGYKIETENSFYELSYP